MIAAKIYFLNSLFHSRFRDAYLRFTAEVLLHDIGQSPRLKKALKFFKIHRTERTEFDNLDITF
jgi:hypothetical protein